MRDYNKWIEELIESETYRTPANDEKLIDYWLFNQFPNIHFGCALLEDTINGERQIRFGIISGEDLEKDLDLLSQCCRRMSPEVLEQMLKGVTATGKIRR